VAEALRPHIGSVIVADASRGMLAQARQKDLAAASADTERLPFPDESFDRVLMVDALHHVVHQGETVCELYRVLKQGGRLVIPLGRQWEPQTLLRCVKGENGKLVCENKLPVAFVPMVRGKSDDGRRHLRP